MMKKPKTILERLEWARSNTIIDVDQLTDDLYSEELILDRDWGLTDDNSRHKVLDLLKIPR